MGREYLRNLLLNIHFPLSYWTDKDLSGLMTCHINSAFTRHEKGIKLFLLRHYQNNPALIPAWCSWCCVKGKDTPTLLIFSGLRYLIPYSLWSDWAIAMYFAVFEFSLKEFSITLPAFHLLSFYSVMRFFTSDRKRWNQCIRPITACLGNMVLLSWVLLCSSASVLLCQVTSRALVSIAVFLVWRVLFSVFPAHFVVAYSLVFPQEW